jgi:hypothetical protein
MGGDGVLLPHVHEHMKTTMPDSFVRPAPTYCSYSGGECLVWVNFSAGADARQPARRGSVHDHLTHGEPAPKMRPSLRLADAGYRATSGPAEDDLDGLQAPTPPVEPVTRRTAKSAGRPLTVWLQ